MKIQTEELAQIITETCEGTIEGMKKAADIIQLISKTTLTVLNMLSQAEKIEFDRSQSRALKDDALAWKIAVKYRERQK